VSERYDGRQIVGLNLHRHRTVMVRMTPGGERLAKLDSKMGEVRWVGSPAAGSRVTR
jgi:hypothetical protein